AFAGLRRHVWEERPLYGLEAPDLAAATGAGAPPASVEELARHYVRRIRRLRPHGPCHLAGWSFGAPLAHALAGPLQRARAQGDLAALVGPPLQGTPAGEAPPEGPLAANHRLAAELLARPAEPDAPRYGGPVLLLTAEDAPDGAAAAWEEAGPSEVAGVAVAAGHLRMLEGAALEAVGAELDARLAGWEREAAGCPGRPALRPTD